MFHMISDMYACIKIPHKEKLKRTFVVADIDSSVLHPPIESRGSKHFITAPFLYCASVVLCLDCASLTVSEVAVKCNNNLYVRGDEADPAQHSAGGSGRKARNV